MPVPPLPAILHYVGDEDDRGVLAAVRNLTAASPAGAMLGVGPAFVAQPDERLPVMRMPALSEGRPGLKSFWRARLVAEEVERWLAAWPERVFHAHSRAGLAVAWWLHRRGERRVVASVHTYGKPRWFYRAMARSLGDRLFWLTPAMKRFYGVKAPGDLWSQCIPSGVELGAAAAPVRERGERKIVHVGGLGTLMSWQCWHLVLDALAAMPAQQRWKVRFEHAGGGDGTEKSRRYELALRTQTGALSLGNLVHWSGAERTAAQLLGEIDVLVVPTLREPLSLAMLEALAAGVPVLAGGAGGARDVLVPSKNGWLFQAGDPRDLARVLVMLVETDALRTVSPRPEPGWRFSSPVVAEQWARVYARVAAK